MHTGSGGFYHWLELPEGLNSVELNRRLFCRGAAILEGPTCDMARPLRQGPGGPAETGSTAYHSPYLRFFRFSFGPLALETFESDIKLLGAVLEQYKQDVMLEHQQDLVSEHDVARS